MKPEKEKLRVVVASGADKAFEYIANLLPVSEFMPAVRAKSAGEAKRMLADNGADILIINTPLPDDFGIMLALDMSETRRFFTGCLQSGGQRRVHAVKTAFGAVFLQCVKACVCIQQKA